jgi:hypothetical protein
LLTGVGILNRFEETAMPIGRIKSFYTTGPSPENTNIFFTLDSGGEYHFNRESSPHLAILLCAAVHNLKVEIEVNASDSVTFFKIDL